MPRKPIEQIWQFHVEDGFHFDNNGINYFEERAAEMAVTLGCRVIGSKNVHLLNEPGTNWIVTGTVILEKASAKAPTA
jgi:hypothetical protein